MKKDVSKFGCFVFALILFLSCGLNLFAAKRYASPSGSASNSGSSEESPWSVAFAFQQTSPLAPGDSLILLDGTYEGNYVLDKSGTAQKPIYILPKNEGKAIFDTGKNRKAETGITVNGSYVWLVGLHVTSSSTIKREDLGESVPYEAGITVLGVGVKLINCWIYDIPGGGLQLWRPALDLEVYGCVIFNNGSQASLRGTGHGMYIQHEDASHPKIIRNNIVFQNASQGINIYTTDPINGGIVSSENTAFNTGAIANFNTLVFRPPHNLTIGSQNNESFDLKVDKNVFYSDLQGGRLSKTQVSNVSLGRNYQPNRNISFTDNLLYGGGNQLDIQPVEKLILTKNKFYNVHGKFFQFLSVPSGAVEVVWNENQYFNIDKNATPFSGVNFSDWKANSGLDAGSSYSELAPNGPQVFVRKNEYDPKKYFITIVNPQKYPSVEVAFSDYSIPIGSKYRIVDIQNPFDASLNLGGAYSGGKVLFPMNLTTSLAPKGNMPHKPVHTDSQFAVFQIEFELEVAAPVFKESITVELNEEGKAVTTLKDYLANEVPADWSATFSRSPEYSCSDLGGAENELKITDSKGNSWTKLVLVKVVDAIPPTVILKPFERKFDLSRGFLEIKAEDFVSSVTDNCAVKSLAINKTRISCTEYQLPVEVVLEAVDQSGNQTREVVFLNLTAFESEKISIFPESGKQYTVGQAAEIRLGSEFEFTLEGWYRNGQRLEVEKGNAILTKEPGTYWAKLYPKGSDCAVESMKTEISFSNLPFGGIRESIQLVLGPEGKAELRPQDVFGVWPLSDPSLEVTLDKTLFSCENIGENLVVILIKKPGGETWERKATVKVVDQTKPTLVPKNSLIELDVYKGVAEITTQMLLSEYGDNCGIKSLTISKNRFTCEDAGKEFSIAIRAEDYSGNVSEALATVSVVRKEPEKILISGRKELCEGEKGVLELSSSKAFEVVRWRRNGIEIQGQTGKSLEVSESGSYHAVIRYPGGCLSETEFVEVKVSSKPSGEVTVDGNILRAPEGNFTYQWFRNGEKINGATTRAFTAEETGEYTVELTNTAGCSAKLKAFNLTISGILGRPVSQATALKIYPNPALDRTVVEFSEGVLAGVFELHVYSSEGKEVSSAVAVTILDDSKIEISLNRIAKGSYLIWVVGEDQKTYFGKLLVAN